MSQALSIASFSVRSAIYVSAFVIGHTINALTSRRALRLYAAIWGAIVYACQSAIESGRIVGAGYYGIEEETAQLVLPTTRIAGLLAPAPEPVAQIHILPLPVLVTPAPVQESVTFASTPKFPVFTSTTEQYAFIHPALCSKNGKPLSGAALRAREKKLQHAC